MHNAWTTTLIHYQAMSHFLLYGARIRPHADCSFGNCLSVPDTLHPVKNPRRPMAVRRRLRGKPVIVVQSVQDGNGRKPAIGRLGIGPCRIGIRYPMQALVNPTLIISGDEFPPSFG